MSKSTFSLPESRIARRLVVTLSVTVNAERDSEQLHKYVGQALLEAANRVDVQVGTASAGKLLSHSYDYGSVEVHVGYSETNTCPKAGFFKSEGGAPDSNLGNVETACEKVEGKEAEVLISAGKYRQPSQREILEQSLVYGAAAKLADHPNQAYPIAQGIKTVLDELHPQSVVTCSPGTETTTLQRLIGDHSAKRNEKTGEELAAHDALTGLAVRGIEVSQNGDILGLRVTPDEVKAEIGAEYSFTLDQVLRGCPVVQGLDRVTIAVIVLKNGTKLVGVNYGAIDPNRHCPETGRREARAHAVEQVWPLMGFRLRDKLAGSKA